MQPVSPAAALLLGTVRQLQAPGRSSAHAAGEFARVARNAAADRLADSSDIIDVEVIWEDGEDAYTPDLGATRPAFAMPQTPMRLAAPGTAIAAYRNAASTAALPHQTIDIFA